MAQSDLKQRKIIDSNIKSELKSENTLYDEETTSSDKQLQTTNTTSSVSLENFCWFIASIACIYFSDIFKILLNDQRIYRSLMYISLGLIGTNLSIALYMIIWLTYIKKISPNKWNDKNPFLIPIATACFIIGSILLIISIWPVYTWLTIPLLFTIFMGFIVIIMNIPA